MFNREIIGYSAGKKKDVKLIQKAFSMIKKPLSQVQIFHKDRESEFKNNEIDKLLEAFNIKSSVH